MAIAKTFGITLADVSGLRLWEFNHLVKIMGEMEAGPGGGRPASTNARAGRRRPPEPGMKPVMT